MSTHAGMGRVLAEPLAASGLMQPWKAPARWAPGGAQGFEPLVPLASLSLDFLGTEKGANRSDGCYAADRDTSVLSAMFASCDRSISLRSACRLLSRTRGSSSRSLRTTQP